MEQPKINGLNERNDNLPDLRKRRSTCILYSILTIILNSIFTDKTVKICKIKNTFFFQLYEFEFSRHEYNDFLARKFKQF